MIGATNLGSAIALKKGGRLAALCSLATGLLLLAWIAIQTRIIGLRHWTQLVWWSVFGLVTALAAREVAGERRAARRAG